MIGRTVSIPVRYVIMCFGLICFQCLCAQTTDNNSIRIYDTFESFEPLLTKSEPNKVYVINFWATWCKPCIAELPYFEAINEELKPFGVEVVLVNLDFKHTINKSLIPFIEKNNIKSEVVMLADEKTNEWIGKVDDSWQGSIPATLIYNVDSYLFMESEIESSEELRSIINQFIKK